MVKKYKLDLNYNMYFTTSSTIAMVPLMINKSLFNIMIDSLVFCQKYKNLKIHCFVIMPNHFHLLVSVPKPENLPGVIRDFKRHTSQKITQYYSNTTYLKNHFWTKRFHGHKVNYVWQRGYHPKAIINEAMYRQKIEYIHQNPVKKGLVLKAEDWPYSSARNYILEDNSLISIDYA